MSARDLAAQRAAEGARLYRRRIEARIYALGQRVTVELIEAARQRARDPDEFDRMLDRYAALDPVVLCGLAAERLPPEPPLRIVPHRLPGARQ